MAVQIDFAIVFTDVGYMSAFRGLRDLASDLRTALQSKEKGSLQRIYNWQFIARIEAWERVVSTRTKSDTFKPLVYPIAQLLMAVTKIVRQTLVFKSSFGFHSYSNKVL